MVFYKVINEDGSAFVLEFLISNSNIVQQLLPIWTDVVSLMKAGKKS